MKKDIHPKTHDVTYKCATCGTAYVFNSTIKGDVMNLDVCANCHPFYKGNNDAQTTKKSNEKLMKKFEKGAARAKK
jgi:large subunit ribosomal protein L31